MSEIRDPEHDQIDTRLPDTPEVRQLLREVRNAKARKAAAEKYFASVYDKWVDAYDKHIASQLTQGGSADE